MKAAIAQAAHDTLVALFPSQAPSFDDHLADDLTEIPDGRLKTNGIALGQTDGRSHSRCASQRWLTAS